MQDDVTAAREMLRAEMAEDHLDLDLCEEDTPDTIAAALRAITLAIRQTREQCAAVAEKDQRSDLAKDLNYEPEFHRAGKRIAAAIRAMGK